MDFTNATKEELIHELQRLKAENHSLLERLETGDVERSQFNFILKERFKELSGINRIIEILSTPGICIDEACENIVNILPESFQFPEYAEAKMVVYGKTFQTPGYRKCRRSLIGKLQFAEDEIGNIEIGYPDDCLPETEPLFLPEETDLMRIVGSSLSGFVAFTVKTRALHESEAVYQSLIENIVDAVYRIDSEGSILYVSPSIKKILGYDPEELIGQRFLDLVGDNREVLLQRMNTLWLGEPIESDYLIKNKTGVDTWIRLSTKPIQSNGVFVGATGTLVDRTEKKQIELELQKSEVLYRSILNASPDVFAILDLEGKIQLVSNKVVQMFGLSNTEDLIGRSFLDFAHLVEYDGLLDPVQKVLNGEVPDTMHIKQERPDGHILYTEIRGDYFYDSEGKPIGMIFAIRDVTDRKVAEIKLQKSEETYRTMIERIHDVIYEIDLQGKIRFVSPAIYPLLGLKLEKVIGHNFLDFVYEADRAAIKKQLQVVDQKESFVEFRYMDPAGELHWVRSSASPLTENGLVTGKTGTVMDVTDRKLAEEEIRNLNANLELKIQERTAELANINADLVNQIEERKRIEEDLKKARLDAEEANQAKSDFLSRMSHELRTPMNSILGFAQLLDMSELDPKQKKGIKHILRSGKLLLELINEVLDISRIESGKLSFSPEPVQICTLIPEILDIMTPIAHQHQVELIRVNCPQSGMFMKIDRQRLKQILINLMTNAIKYNKKGGKVQISSERRIRTSDQLPVIRISITDTGTGISPENIYKIFRPFERLDAEKTDSEGTGLGLAVVKKLVEAMDGQISVESTLGQGSTFWFEMPEAESLMEIMQSSNLTYAPKHRHKHGVILYIEDNVSNVELVEQIVYTQRSEMKLVTCKEGKTGVRMASEIQPDLILLDLNLPDIHGREVLAILKNHKRTKDIPVVVISADAMPKQMENTLNAGAKAYLSKPLDVECFLKMIDESIQD